MSGHWGKYRENMFLVLDNETGEQDFVAQADELPVAPPAVRHRGSTRYRELPLRYSTYDVLHRNEVSGRAGRPDARAPVPAGRLPHLPDGDHRSPTRSQRLTRFILDYYATFGLTATLKLRHPAASSESATTRCGTAPRAALRAALEATGLAYELKPGDGAFYGPKIDFDVADSIGRDLAAGHHPARLRRRRSASTSTYIGEDNNDAPAGGDPPRDLRLVRALHRAS